MHYPLSRLMILRHNAFKKQDGFCYYCEHPMWEREKKLKKFADKHQMSISEAGKYKCTAEHLVARCDGGKDKKSNIVAACLFCNGERHRMQNPPDHIEYKKIVIKRIDKGAWKETRTTHNSLQKGIPDESRCTR